MDWYSVVYPAVQILVTNTDKLLGWPFEEVGREELRDGGLGDRIQSEGNPSTHWRRDRRDSMQKVSRTISTPQRQYFEQIQLENSQQR